MSRKNPLPPSFPSRSAAAVLAAPRSFRPSLIGRPAPSTDSPWRPSAVATGRQQRLAGFRRHQGDVRMWRPAMFQRKRREAFAAKAKRRYGGNVLRPDGRLAGGAGPPGTSTV